MVQEQGKHMAQALLSGSPLVVHVLDVNKKCWLVSSSSGELEQMH